MVSAQRSTNGRVAPDDWDLIRPDLDIAAIGLLELLDRGEQEDDKTPPYNHISIRLLQPTLMMELVRLKRIKRLSLSCVERLATKHGVALLREGGSWSRLDQASGEWEEQMHKIYANDRVAALTGKTTLAPEGCVLRSTSISLYNDIHGALMDLASDAAVQLQYAVQFCILASLITVRPVGGYYPIAVNDLQRLEDRIGARIASLAVSTT